jgi:hypothetical protein
MCGQEYIPEGKNDGGSTQVVVSLVIEIEGDNTKYVVLIQAPSWKQHSSFPTALLTHPAQSFKKDSMVPDSACLAHRQC